MVKTLNEQNKEDSTKLVFIGFIGLAICILALSFIYKNPPKTVNTTNTGYYKDMNHE